MPMSKMDVTVGCDEDDVDGTREAESSVINSVKTMIHLVNRGVVARGAVRINKDRSRDVEEEEEEEEEEEDGGNRCTEGNICPWGESTVFLGHFPPPRRPQSTGKQAGTSVGAPICPLLLMLGTIVCLTRHRQRTVGVTTKLRRHWQPVNRGIDEGVKETDTNAEEDERQQIRRVDRNRLKEVRQGDRKVDQKSVEAAEKPKPKH
ncbi:hypothetical protein RUM44_003515 [Polyplax serrata]|uniref:Uncharacterized protein n=1 Tax=Polyplax serrata TaxID=468196 RepID=A0ABR1AGN0_POLSC